MIERRGGALSSTSRSFLYGHHGDLAGGSGGAVEEAAAAVDDLSAPRWCSLAQIARTGFQTRREGGLLRVQLLARRARASTSPRA